MKTVRVILVSNAVWSQPQTMSSKLFLSFSFFFHLRAQISVCAAFILWSILILWWQDGSSGLSLKFCQGSGPMGKKGAIFPLLSKFYKILEIHPYLDWFTSHIHPWTNHPVARRPNFRRPAGVFYLLELIMEFSLNHMGWKWESEVNEHWVAKRACVYYPTIRFLSQSWILKSKSR